MVLQKRHIARTGDGTGCGFAQEDQETEPATINDQSWGLGSFINCGSRPWLFISGGSLLGSGGTSTLVPVPSAVWLLASVTPRGAP
jgi:hypothetical protein